VGAWLGDEVHIGDTRGKAKSFITIRRRLWLCAQASPANDAVDDPIAECMDEWLEV
jgi:hypothetical protein